MRQRTVSRSGSSSSSGPLAARDPKIGLAAGGAEMRMRRREASAAHPRPMVPVEPTADGAASYSAVQRRRSQRTAHGPSWSRGRRCPAEHAARCRSCGVADGVVNQVGPSGTAHGSSELVKAHTPCRGRHSCRNMRRHTFRYTHFEIQKVRRVRQSLACRRAGVGMGEAPFYLCVLTRLREGKHCHYSGALHQRRRAAGARRERGGGLGGGGGGLSAKRHTYESSHSVPTPPGDQAPPRLAKRQLRSAGSDSELELDF